jgi:hypothetical protein
MADPTAWTIVDTSRPVSEPVYAADDRRPVRRRRGQADIAA